MDASAKGDTHVKGGFAHPEPLNDCPWQVPLWHTARITRLWITSARRVPGCETPLLMGSEIFKNDDCVCYIPFFVGECFQHRNDKNATIAMMKGVHCGELERTLARASQELLTQTVMVMVTIPARLQKNSHPCWNP
eukprot:3222876-Amphidinium_carterae.1